MTIRVQQDDHEEQETERIGGGQTVGQAIDEAYRESGVVLRPRDYGYDTVKVNDEPSHYGRVLTRDLDNAKIEVTTEAYQAERAATSSDAIGSDTIYLGDDFRPSGEPQNSDKPTRMW